MLIEDSTSSRLITADPCEVAIMHATGHKAFFPMISLFCMAVLVIFSVAGWNTLNSLWAILRTQL